MALRSLAALVLLHAYPSARGAVFDWTCRCQVPCSTARWFAGTAIFRRTAQWSVVKRPCNRARDIPHSPRQARQQQKSGCTGPMAGSSSPPSSTSPEQPNGSLRLSTVPGPDRVVPAAHRRALTGHTRHPVATAHEPAHPIGRWPSQRHGSSGRFAGQLQSPSARVAPHPELPALLLAKLNMRRGRSVRAPLLLPGPSTSHWLRPHDQNWHSFFDRYQQLPRASCHPHLLVLLNPETRNPSCDDILANQREVSIPRRHLPLITCCALKKSQS